MFGAVFILILLPLAIVASSLVLYRLTGPKEPKDDAIVRE